MTEVTSGWNRYEAWNSAVAEVIYPRSAAGTPVYLDLEDDVLAAIRDAAEPDASDPAKALVAAVKQTLGLNYGSSGVFGNQLRWLTRWRHQGSLNAPPTLALLAVLSLAAENMHEGGGQAANNFYGRLAELLALTEVQKDRLITAYRMQGARGAVSQELWSSVNQWLEILEGNRGIPTAFAISHAHVGLPMSQALVRRTDRDKFGEMFWAYGLAPHSPLPTVEMEQLLAEWIGRHPCPVSHSLEVMFKKDAAARERIADVARLTLETWDGSDGLDDGAPTTPGHVDAVRVKALLRTFPNRHLDITLVLPARTDAGVEALDVLDHDRRTIGSIDLVSAASGWLTPADPMDLDSTSLLEGEILLRRNGQSAVLRRRPRRLVPMRFDDMLRAFVECERVQLGEDALVLVTSVVAPQVAELLAVAARPGFTRHHDLPGLPAGWELFDNVQILSSLPDHLLRQRLLDLNALQPLATSQVVVQGGLKLPGNILKWSSLLPPVLRVSAGFDSNLSARIVCIRSLVSPTPPDTEKIAGGPVLTWDLTEELLPDGDYEISVVDRGEVASTRTLRLRSADNPALDFGDYGTIVHTPSAPLFGLFGTSSEGQSSSFRGAPIQGRVVDRDLPPPTRGAHWYGARRNAIAQPKAKVNIVFARVDEKSCMATGAHYMDVEMARPGHSTMEGVCRYCGLVRRFPSRGRKKSTRGTEGSTVAPSIDVRKLDVVKSTPTMNWSAAFDAVSHVGRGSIAQLEKIASQIEATGLFGDMFERRLEMMGHIEVAHDPKSLLAKSWDVVDPLLIGLESGDHVLAGFRSEKMLVELEDFVYRKHGEHTEIATVNAPPVIRIGALSSQDITELAVALCAVVGRQVTVVPHAASRLAAQLPPLSRLLEHLPVTATIGARSFEHWNTTTARFEEMADATGQGAFRLRGFTRAYIFRRSQDVGTTQAVLGDARIVKYAAALDAKNTLIGYDLDAEVLYVPLGADLPGLYGRAAVLASGKPPRENEEDGILEYRGLSPQLAGQLEQLLMS